MKIIGQGIRQQAEKGKPLEIRVTQAKRMKTTAQNSFYYALLALIADYTGEDSESIKFRMKIQLGYFDEIWVSGIAEKKVKSMAKVSVDESNIFIDAALQICSHLNLRVPAREQHYREINYASKG